MKGQFSSSLPLAKLSIEEMQVAIPKLDRGIDALKGFDIKTISKGNEPEIVALSQRISRLIIGIFGNDTFEYNQYHSFSNLSYLSLSLHNNPSDIRGIIRHKVEHAISTLESIKQGFLEELEEIDRLGFGVRAIKAYEGLSLHPKIEIAVNALFLDGHYANAIEDSVKALSEMVRLKSGFTEDGVALMQKAFSPKNPKLKFNLLEDRSDEDEQKGFMDLFTGAVSGLRNPRAHKIIKDDPDMGLEFIAFVSLLAKLLDKTLVNENHMATPRAITQ
ncbi:TIGR02391 family protein [Legionella longbeachae]|uniref:TIGR02391 family protein n=1 Tax=Legionella longbeachae TaxID=450 RepID=UPI000F704530|nr:TIGR02391 family protein [Legionella longbeachae]UAK47123.1 TIGR02391 family protein [Legionella longbeachae]VEE04186.1 Protein of uncharacterised function (Hypoth_ymh) [Legionella oakridgensis]